MINQILYKTSTCKSMVTTTGNLGTYFPLHFALKVYLKSHSCPEAAVGAGRLALQFGWCLSALRQFLRGEADVLQRSRPPVWTQSGCTEDRQTAQPLICLPRKVSELFLLLFIDSLKNIEECFPYKMSLCLLPPQVKNSRHPDTQPGWSREPGQEEREQAKWRGHRSCQHDGHSKPQRSTRGKGHSFT